MKSQSGIRTASIVPLVATLGLIALSASVYLFRVELANNIFFIIGYLLTPVGVTFTMAWDLLSQRKGRVNPNFDVRPIYSKIIRYLVILGYAIGVLHIFELGRLLGEFVVQSGVAG